MLLSATFFGQHALESLRLGENDAVKRAQLSEPPVEARLWEDPLAALVRHRKVCPVEAKEGSLADPRCKSGERKADTLQADLRPDTADLTVIAALLPGAGFVGAEEARRRLRYAVLAGLSAEGFIPDDSEHMGLLRARPCDVLSKCGSQTPVIASLPHQEAKATPVRLGMAVTSDVAEEGGAKTENEPVAGNNTMNKAGATPLKRDVPQNEEIDIPYELFRARGLGQAGLESRRAIVLWVDDTRISKRWLSTLTVLLGQVAPAGDTVRVSIIGPFTSDKLVDALGDDLWTLEDEARAFPPPGDRKSWRTLAKLRLISPFSTAPAGYLREAAQRQTEQRKAEQRAAKPASSATEATPATLFEPCREDATKPQSVWSVDCIDRAFKDRLTAIVKVLQEVDQEAGGKPVRLGPDRFFLRTIGADDWQIELLVMEMASRGLATEGGRVILLREWDSIYARTFAQALEAELKCRKLSPSIIGEPISVRVYSYLRGLDGSTVEGAAKQQRLLAKSGDKARDERKEADIEWPESRDQRDYVRRLVGGLQKEADHDKTRIRAIGLIGADIHDKLILAQAVRAAFKDRVIFTTDLDARLMHPDALKYSRNLVVASSLPLVPESQPAIRVAPFRDAYQTAAFLGARYAGAQDQSASIVEGELRNRLFEIGSDGEVVLGIEGVPKSELERRRDYAFLSFVVLVALGGLMLFGKPGPAMKAALSAWKEPPSFADAMISGAGVAAWGFALGVVIELGWPGLVGLDRAAFIAAALGLSFLAMICPGLRGSPWGIARLAALVAIAALAIPLWTAVAPAESGMREPFAPLSGISAWPSQLLRTLAVLLFAWFLDFTWNGSADAGKKFGKHYFGIEPAPTPPWPNPFRALWSGARFVWSTLRAGLSPRTWRRLAKIPPVAASIKILLAAIGRTWRRFVDETLPRIGRALRASSVWFWQLPVEQRPGEIDGTVWWRSYLDLLRNWPRLGRLALWFPAMTVLVGMERVLIGGELPEIPARGLDDRALFEATIYLSVFGTVILLVLVGDAAVLTWRFVYILKGGRTVYPDATVERFWARLGTEASLKGSGVEATAHKPIQAHVEDRRKGSTPGYNSLLDDWIDARLLAEHTAKLGPLIFCPFILLALLLIARSRLFDNWAPSGIVLFALVTYLLWAVIVATMLNIGAEIARRDALDSMRADLRWMEGAGKEYEGLVKQYKSVIEDVENLRQGAFAPFFEQPLLRAVLVPLGGVGGIQLLEYFMFSG